MTLLTIGIPTYNRPVALAKILQQLESALAFTNHDVVVHVQDNSDPCVQEINRITAKECSHCTYAANLCNIGFGGNMLRILEQCSSEYLLYLSDDDDLWIEYFCGMVDTLSDNEGILLLPFTYGADMSSITNTNLTWSSASVLSELYPYGLPFVLFSGFVIPVPSEVAKNQILDKLLPYTKNCCLQMAIPVALQDISNCPLKISYFNLPIVRYITAYEYGFSLKETFQSLNEIFTLLLSTAIITPSLYRRKISDIIRMHLLNALRHKAGLTKIPNAQEYKAFLAIKGLLSIDLKNFMLAATLLLAPASVVRKVLLSRGHTDSLQGQP